jgi:serpin B
MGARDGNDGITGRFNLRFVSRTLRAYAVSVRWSAAILSLAVPMYGCGLFAGGGQLVKSDRPRDTSVTVPAGDLRGVSDGNTRFALDLYHRLREHKSQDDLFFSPYSVSTAFAMTYAGARGDTASQMAEVLHFDQPKGALHAAFNALDLKLASRGERSSGRHGEPFRLHIVNVLWGQTDYEFLPSFLDLLAENYGAGIRLLDFDGSPERSRSTINKWVGKQTEDQIGEVIPAGGIPPLTRLVITNAIYFDAAWQHKFRHAGTEPRPFKLLDGSEVTVDMMHQKSTFPYAQAETCQVIELPYEGGELSMVIFLPSEERFAEFDGSLEAVSLDALTAALSPVEVRLAMPKLNYESWLALGAHLAEMGTRDAFAQGVADFSGMDGTRWLFLQGAYHRALIRVDEEGTEAAAATAVIVAGAGEEPLDIEPVVMTIDRPFIFLIRDIETDTILFLGRVLNPAVPVERS